MDPQFIKFWHKLPKFGTRVDTKLGKIWLRKGDIEEGSFWLNLYYVDIVCVTFWRRSIE